MSDTVGANAEELDTLELLNCGGDIDLSYTGEPFKLPIDEGWLERLMNPTSSLSAEEEPTDQPDGHCA